MIPHPAPLDAAYGVTPWAPYCLVTLTDPSGAAVDVNPTDGVIRHDLEAWPRTELSMSLPTAITPDRTTPPVSPWGGTVTVVSGATVGGVDYVFQAAHLDVAEVGIRRPDGTIPIRAVSQEARVNEDRYDADTATAAGLVSAVVTAAIRRTLGPTWPVSNLLTTDPTLAAGQFTFSGDVWPTIEDLMNYAGGEAFFDHTGTLILRPVPVKGTPAVSLRVGAGGVVTAYESQRRWAKNRTVVRFTQAGAVVRTGTWEDTAPTSLTRVSGPYGRHTELLDVAVGSVPTLAAANAYAAAVARRAAAPYRRVTVDAVPAPWVTPGDTMRVDLLGGLTETLLVAALEWPLSQLDPSTFTAVDDAYTLGA